MKSERELESRNASWAVPSLHLSGNHSVPQFPPGGFQGSDRVVGLPTQMERGGVRKDVGFPCPSGPLLSISVVLAERTPSP